MSTTQTSRYEIIEILGYAPHRYQLVDRACERVRVDAFRTRSGAEYACRLLNQGQARINPHATVGCRVEAR